MVRLKWPRLPTITAPVDADDLWKLAALLLASLLVLWVAMIVGLAVRVFLLASGL